MIKGMTGFGSATLSSGTVNGVVEVKSVNHRYMDVSYYLPIGFASIENKIRQVLGKFVARGRINVAIKIFKKPMQAVSFNKKVASAYVKHAKSLKKGLGLSGDISISDIIALPGVVETRETEISPEELWPAIEKSLTHAIKSLVVMRAREGKSLYVNLAQILSRMLLRTKRIQTREQAILKVKKKRLSDEEFTAFQKSYDVSEEITRLIHHVEEFKLLLKSTVAVGKNLDFIAQEMQRETNTIGSKLQDKIVSKAVIALKSKIEKLREQSQNIE